MRKISNNAPISHRNGSNFAFQALGGQLQGSKPEMRSERLKIARCFLTATKTELWKLADRVAAARLGGGAWLIIRDLLFCL